MGVGLQPLEFTECLADSPHFRENLQRHEKELERTSQQIKRLIKEVKDVVQAAKRLGAAQLALAASMEQFEFACIGASMTDDERVIGASLQQFAQLIRIIEDERDRMLGRAHEQIIQPLERFRKEHIGAVKEGKKKFDKKTAKFCQSQERTLSLSTKKPETVFQEADAAMDMAERDFCQASLEYVFQLQAVQERKKFELVETLLGFVFGWWTFHHTAHDVHADARPLVQDLQLRIQRTRSNFEETSKQTESLMKKMMEVRQMNKEDEGVEEGAGGVSRAGYLFLMEKKAFGTTWSKQYCTYEKGSRTLSLLPYNQINVKTAAPGDSVRVAGARAAADAERRFCWEAAPAERERAPLTLQALSERDRAAWLRALDSPPHAGHAARALPPAAERDAPGAPDAEAWPLDDAGFAFVRRVIAVLEARGLEEQGLYRVAGVASKVSRLVALARERRLPAALGDPLEWESKTLTSALKAYLRALPEPLLTRRLHRAFLAAAKCERRDERAAALRALVHALPPRNLDMLRLVLAHLVRVAARCERNLMSPSNLAVCFGPTLLRAERETVASILELKFYNVLVEALIENYAAVFSSEPPPAPAPPPAPPAPPAPAAPPAPPHAHNERPRPRYRSPPEMILARRSRRRRAAPATRRTTTSCCSTSRRRTTARAAAAAARSPCRATARRRRRAHLSPSRRAPRACGRCTRAWARARASCPSSRTRSSPTCRRPPSPAGCAARSTARAASCRRTTSSRCRRRCTRRPGRPSRAPPRPPLARTAPAVHRARRPGSPSREPPRPRLVRAAPAVPRRTPNIISL